MLCQLYDVLAFWLGSWRWSRLWGQEHTINDVNHAIACLVVSLDDILEILAVRTNANFAAPSCYVQRLTFHSLDILGRLQIS